MSLDNIGKELATDADGNEIGKLFVGGLSQSTCDSSLRAYFIEYGDVEDAVVMMDNRTGRSRGFGYVKFRDCKSVNQVLNNNHHVIDGKSVDAKKCNINMKGKSSRSLKIFVGGIAPEHDIDVVKHFFAQYGNVTEVNLMLDQSKQRHRGFAFVGFDDESVVKKLIQTHYLTMKGKTVEIKQMEPPNFLVKATSGDTQPAITRYRSDSVVYPATPNTPVWTAYDGRTWMAPPVTVPSWSAGHQWYGPPCGYVDGSPGPGWTPTQWGPPPGWYPPPPPPVWSHNGQTATTTAWPPGPWSIPPTYTPSHYSVGWDPANQVTVWPNPAAATSQRLDYDHDSIHEESPSRMSSPLHPNDPDEEVNSCTEPHNNYWMYDAKLVGTSDSANSAPNDQILAHNHVAAGDFNRNNNKMVVYDLQKCFR